MDRQIPTINRWERLGGVAMLLHGSQLENVMWLTPGGSRASAPFRAMERTECLQNLQVNIHGKQVCAQVNREYSSRASELMARIAVDKPQRRPQWWRPIEPDLPGQPLVTFGKSLRRHCRIHMHLTAEKNGYPSP